MRVNPSAKAVSGGKTDPAVQERLEYLCRNAAIALVFAGTFFFLFKIVFF